MAGNYTQLLDIINNPTQHGLPAWDNNAKQIEGETVQQYLLYIINSLTVGYQFMGVASTNTSGGTPDQNVFYLAGAGTYNGFGSTPITIDAGYIGIIRWNGAWSSDTIKIADIVSVTQNILTIGGEEKGAIADKWEENPLWAFVVVDYKKRILFGIKRDGTIEWSKGIPSAIKNAFEPVLANIQTITDNFSLEENPIFFNALVDANRRILEAIKRDGTRHFYKDVHLYSKLFIGDREFSLNDIYDEIATKIAKPQSSTPNHIVVFDEDGEVKDSGMSVNDLPSELPSGGSDGDVLKTDGNGNLYWDSSTAPSQSQVDEATNIWLSEHSGAVATVQNNNEFDLAIADEQGNIGAGIKKGNWLCGNFNSLHNGNQWWHKKWYAYGTSLTAAGSGKYPLYVSRMAQMYLTNKGAGGAGIVKGLSGNLDGANFDAICNITDGKLDADIITIEVGANDGAAALGDVYDYTHNTTFCGALNMCIKYLLENTNAQIVVMSSSPSIYAVVNWEVDRNTPYYIDHRTGPDNHTWLDTVNAIEQVCKANRVHYIGWENSGLGIARLLSNGTTYVVDQIHHSDLMGKILGEFIWSKLKEIPIWHTSIINTNN